MHGRRDGRGRRQDRRRHGGETRQDQALDASLVVLVEGVLDAVRSEGKLRPKQGETEQNEAKAAHHAPRRVQSAQVPRTA